MSDLAIQLINQAYEEKATFLDLGNCGLTSIPKEIAKLKDTLRELNLSSWYYVNNEEKASANRLAPNSFEDNLYSLTILFKLQNIKELHISGCRLSDKGAYYIYKLSSLISLDISTNQLENASIYICELTSLSSLRIRFNYLETISAEHIRRLTSLTLLDISYNQIGDKGAEYISELRSLISLNIAYNNVGENGVKYITQLSSLSSLDISDNKIGEKGAEYVSQLPLLTSLGISDNQIGEKGAKYISHLNSLTLLDISDNQIGQIGAEYISHLTSLSSLNIENNAVGEKGAEYISRLTSLTSLSIGNNAIGEKGAEYISHLVLLTSLTIDNNKIGEKGTACIRRLSQLRSLNIGENGIRDMGAAYVSQLSSLTSLNISKNAIGNRGAAYISRLYQLTVLEIENSVIGDDGAECIARLPLLSVLNLAKNRITRFSIPTTNHITTLHLQKNHIKTIAAHMLRYVPLDIDMVSEDVYGTAKIFLYGNPIENPPAEVISKGRTAILEYWEGPQQSLNECKLIFVGDGGVGKTSLMKLLVTGKFEKGERTTHGINKIAWRELTTIEGQPIKVNLWDFGGQHIQHSLHQFFFTKRVIYVLVLNPRNDEKAGYWLDQVDKLGGGSQVIIVYNQIDKKDTQADYLKNFIELRKTYKYLPEPIVLCCATGEGMQQFKDAVMAAVRANEGLKTKYPATWFKIKERLETGIPVEKHYIQYNEYEQWCHEEQYDDPERRRSLLQILDSVGAIVFFDKPGLNALQVLNPEWISTGAYAIITSEITRQRKGHLTWADLRQIFKTPKEIFADKEILIQYEEPHFTFILQLMKDYWLCQEDPFEQNAYLVPAAFGEKPAKEYPMQDGRHYRLRFQSPFEMLIIHRFIARNVANIIDKDYWNSGIYFKHATSNTFALVETNQHSKVIDCWIRGENIRGMWEVMRNDFREILKMYERLEADEEVEYTSEGRTVFLNYEDMIRALRNGVNKIPYDTKTGLKDIDVNYVLELFESPTPSSRPITAQNTGGNIHVEVNPHINVNPHISNNSSSTITPQERPKQQPTPNKAEENKKVKQWKNKALITAIVSAIVTLLLVLDWKKHWLLSAETWAWLEDQKIIAGLLILAGAAWSGFILKSLYDRFYDPSKEKAYRERMRN